MVVAPGEEEVFKRSQTMVEVAEKAKNLRKSMGVNPSELKYARGSTMMTGGDQTQRSKVYVRRSDMKEEQYGYYSDDFEDELDVQYRPSRVPLVDPQVIDQGRHNRSQGVARASDIE